MNAYREPDIPARRVDVSDPVDVAADLLARIASYDSTAPVPSAELLSDWASSIFAAGVEYQFLVEGVHRVFAVGGGDPPRSKLGAVIAAGKVARAESGKGSAVRELGPAVSFDDAAPGGYAIEGAYRVDGAIGLGCPADSGCGARPNEWCEVGGRLKQIPCTARLRLAYRTNNAQGRERSAAREEHLREHRRTWKPKK